MTDGTLFLIRNTRETHKLRIKDKFGHQDFKLRSCLDLHESLNRSSILHRGMQGERHKRLTCAVYSAPNSKLHLFELNSISMPYLNIIYPNIS